MGTQFLKCVVDKVAQISKGKKNAKKKIEIEKGTNRGWGKEYSFQRFHFKGIQDHSTLGKSDVAISTQQAFWKQVRVKYRHLIKAGLQGE